MNPEEEIGPYSWLKHFDAKDINNKEIFDQVKYFLQKEKENMNYSKTGYDYIDRAINDRIDSQKSAVSDKLTCRNAADLIAVEKAEKDRIDNLKRLKKIAKQIAKWRELLAARPNGSDVLVATRTITRIDGTRDDQLSYWIKNNEGTWVSATNGSVYDDDGLITYFVDRGKTKAKDAYFLVRAD